MVIVHTHTHTHTNSFWIFTQRGNELSSSFSYPPRSSRSGEIGSDLSQHSGDSAASPSSWMDSVSPRKSLSRFRSPFSHIASLMYFDSSKCAFWVTFFSQLRMRMVVVSFELPAPEELIRKMMFLLLPQVNCFFSVQFFLVILRELRLSYTMIRKMMFLLCLVTITFLCGNVSTEKEKRDLLPHKDEDDFNNNRQEETNKTSFTTVALCVSFFLHLLLLICFLFFFFLLLNETQCYMIYLNR